MKGERLLLLQNPSSPMQHSHCATVIRTAGLFAHPTINQHRHGDEPNRLAASRTDGSVSRAVHNMVTVSTCDEIYTMLANSINEILPEVAAVIIGLYGQNDGPVNWTYAAYQGKNIPPDEVPDLLKELAGKQTIPQQLEPAGVFSGGKASPQPETRRRARRVALT